MATILIFILGLGSILVLLFLIYTLYVAFIHWKYSHLPSPKLNSFYLGHLADHWKFMKTVHKEVTTQFVVKYWADQVESKTFVIFFPVSPFIVTLDPTVVKEVIMDIKNSKSPFFVKKFSTVFGERFIDRSLLNIPDYLSWKPRRQLYDQAFKKSYLNTLMTTFNDCINKFVEELKPIADGNTIIPLKKYIRLLTMNIISMTGFGTDFSQIWSATSLGVDMPPDELNCFSYVVAMAFQGLNKSIFFGDYSSIYQLLYPNAVKKYKKCIKALRKIGRDGIMRRIKMIQSGEEIPRDIITYMLLTNTDNWLMDELVDDFITFFLAGQDTSSITTIFALVLLFQHPNVLERVQQEIKDVLGSKTTVDEKDLEDLHYINQVVLETLRLYPPFFGQLKYLPSKCKLANLSIPGGTNVMLMNANISRLDENFDNPDVFNPDRFSHSHIKPNSFIYFPFGVGHRSCIGKHFAMMVIKTTLAKIIQSFTIQLPSNYKLKAIQRVILQIEDDLPCTLKLN